MSQAKEAVKQSEFSALRAIFWPIHNYEIKKFLPMGLMMFCILFNYTVLRDTKDTLMVNAPGSGAEALAYVKLFGTTPAAILFMIVYAKLSNILSRQGLFYSVLLSFLIFFAAFALFIYPNREALHMSEAAIVAMKADYPNVAWLISVIGNWSYSLFYILSELWGSAVISLLFWQFANEITRIPEAKRFYGMFGLIGNFGLVLSGFTVYYFSKNRGNLPAGVDPWGWTLNHLMTFVVLSGIVVVAIYAWMNKIVLTDKRYYDGAAEAGSKKKDKPKLSLSESFMYLARSPYLGMIAMIVLAYGVSINIVEGVWKGQIRVAFHGDNNAYNAFMGQFSATTGVITILLMVAGNNILRRFSWLSAAIITPIMILVTSLIFFGVIMYSESIGNPEFAIAGTTMVMIAVMTGFVQNVLTKSTKYSLFDPTKEMAYIPLDQELKVKGKAAVDVIGGRAGKSGGAMIQVGLLGVFAGQTLASLSPIFAIITVVVVGLWLVSVCSLSKRFEALTKRREQEAAQAKASEA
jgi:ATP:ADP antiporter, AAA family